MLDKKWFETWWMGPALELADSADWSVPGMWSLLDAAVSATAKLSGVPDADKDHAFTLAAAHLGRALEEYESANPHARTTALAVKIGKPKADYRDSSVEALIEHLVQIGGRLLDLAETGGLTLREQQEVVHAFGWVVLARNRLRGGEEETSWIIR